MTTSAARKRIVASEKFEEKVVKKNVNGSKGKKSSFWSSLPLLVGNWVLKLFQSCKVEGQRQSGISGALAL
ncbi:hypothetical protein GAYE_PCTG33G0932 [Galdieria yellowstonensis]|uniref:Uncharacterized protein n=1 Tax=Galdieria yellowstonensis TaxID=3028027 RepID=A0AAV9I530_9RHOD|nr:hypothetical protein GAYE_PCTG33G0932 [Galdieria yellowstonensis]